MNIEHSMINPVVPLEVNDSVTMIATAKNFLSPEQCDQVIAMCEQVSFSDGTIGQENNKSNLRNSKVTCVSANEENMWLFKRLELAIRQMNNAYKYNQLGFYEGIQVASYQSGGKYDWHIDVGPKQNSSRKLSMSIQLTDPAECEGGNLEFMNVADVGERARGTLIVFPSFLQHRVTPVISGNRYSMVAWVHGKPFS